VNFKSTTKISPPSFSLSLLLVLFIKFAFLGCVIVLFADCAGAQTPLQVLQQTAAVYRNLSSYEFQVTVQTKRGSDVTEQRLTEMGLNPGKFRIEDEDSRGGLRIADGQNQWIFNRSTNEYSKAPLNADTPTPISDLENIDQHVSQAQFVREELFVAEGRPVRVVVVEVVRDRWPNGTLQGAKFVMYRIDEKNFRVYKANTYSSGDTQIVLYSILKWNQPVPDTSFAFVPPPNSHSVFSVHEQAESFRSLIGTQAPDFTLQDTDGHSVNLRSLLGKVVIVDFWATWCPPCRAQMPELQRISQESEKQGLVVLGLDVGETANEVSQFARKGSYTFTMLLGAEPETSAEYYVEAYPTTFVVDRQGHITFSSTGGEPPDRLRSAVAAALRQ
jgi:outer membrane lipoprotein-sorting protein/peroxiredoxin